MKLNYTNYLTQKHKSMKHVVLSNRLATMLAFFFLCVATAFAQITVKGTVTDGTGEPVIVASVLEKGTTNGIMTDIDGNYTLTVKQGATLVFSYVGLTTQEITAKAGVLNVKLEDNNKILDDVVVVGYGVQKKSSVTGAISQVKAEDMQNRTISDPGQALQGKTSGVQVVNASSAPGSNPSIRVRGYSSNATSDPLYVVDGVRLKNISGIDPNDIASMEVLKDAASAAIYGAEAGNGVVLITTKKGKSGQGKIAYDLQFASQSLARVPKLLNAEEYIQYQKEGGVIGDEMIKTYYDGKTDTDWVKESFENSALWKHNLSFTGGSDRGNYYLSLTYLSNNGIVKGNKDTYKRLTAAINAEHKIKDWFKVGTTNNIEKYDISKVTESSEYGSLITTLLGMDPLTPVSYAGGESGLPSYLQTIKNTPDANGVYPVFLKDENGNYYGISQFYTAEAPNPFIQRDSAVDTVEGWRVNGSIYGDLTPVKGLTITSRFGYSLQGTHTNSVSLPGYGNVRNDKRQMTSLSTTTTNSYYYQWENFANYMKTFGKNTINAMAGISFQETVRMYTNGGLSNSAPDHAVKKNDPLFYYLNFAADSAIKTVGGERTNSTKYSWFARLGYDWAGKYMVQGSLRADAADSSVLPLEKRWGYFPAVSAGWSISEEGFFEDVKETINSLKLRASWGQNGSLGALGGYMYSTDMSLNGYYPLAGVNPDGSYNYTIAVQPTSLGNKNLKWETSEQFNIGLDAAAYNGRLTFGMDYYIKKTKDLLVSGVKPSFIIGGTTSPMNAGNVENSGWEFDLGWRDQIGAFTYSIKGNIATLKNEVTYLDPSIPRINGAIFHNQPVTVFEQGYPVYHFYGYRYAGVDKATGNPMFYNANNEVVGNPTVDDKCDLGSAMPKVNYGITITAAWKGIDLTIFGTGAAGNKIFSCMQRPDYQSSNKLKEFFYDDRWTSSNTNGTVPRSNCDNLDKYVLSDAMVYSGAYFKFKQIQLGYTLPKNALKKAFINHSRIYVSLDDFFTITKYPGMDPEACVSGISGMGVDKGAYPLSKKLVVGLNIEF